MPVGQLYPKDWNNFSPRAERGLGPEGRRPDGGARRLGALLRRLLARTSSWASSRGTPSTPARPTTTSSSASRRRPSSCPGSPSSPTSRPPTSSRWTRSCKTPYVQNYNVNVQQQLGPHAALQVGYVGSLGRELFRYRDINQPDPADRRAPLPGLRLHQPVRVDRRLALQLAADLRSRSRTGRASPPRSTTRSASRSTPRATVRTTCPTPRSPTTAATPRRSWRRSNFDVRHRFAWLLHLEHRSRARAMP